MVISTHANETSTVNTARAPTDYECPVAFGLKNLVSPPLKIVVTRRDPICPSMLGEMVVAVEGEFLIPFDHPDIGLIDFTVPEFNPVTAYVRFTNVDPDSGQRADFGGRHQL